MINKATPSYQLEVCVKGKPVTKYNAPDKIDDVWIEGRAGTEYTIRLRNNSSQRAKFVVSVDGLSINDGKPCGLASPGYILNPLETLDIPGWLVDNARAAKFTFGSKASSYAATQGDASNTGVIGLLVFGEKYKAPVYRGDVIPLPYTPDPFVRYQYTSALGDQPLNADVIMAVRDNIPMFGSAVGSAERRITSSTASLNASVQSNYTAAPEPSLGTEFGSATDFKTQKVEFVQASNSPTYTTSIYYDDAKGLNRIGIVLDWQKTQTVRPNPFPADPDFCKKPVGWS